jgi:hypothetical protein
MEMALSTVTLLSILLLGSASADSATNLLRPLDVVRQVGPDGRGSAEAARAWRELAGASLDQVPELLAGMDGTSPLARNWIRSAIERVLENGRARRQTIPAAPLEAFVRDTQHDAQARRLAYELIAEADRTVPERLLPGLLDDPSADLRRDAVGQVLGQAEKLFDAGKKDDALPLFRKAFVAARDKDQLDQSARRLRDLGQKVDLAAHLGMVTN